MQVHAGVGDSDLFMPRADPGYLKPLIERFRDTPVVRILRENALALCCLEA